MSEVTSLEISRELYEVSGWSDTYLWHKEYMDGRSVAHPLVAPKDMAATGFGVAPAYDLGYLLRKLPRWYDHDLVKGPLRPFLLQLQPSPVSTNWQAFYRFEVDDANGHRSAVAIKVEASTPEDAATKLAIELFKQGVLTRGES